MNIKVFFNSVIFLICFFSLTFVENVSSQNTVKIGNQVWMGKNLDVDIGNSWWPQDKYCKTFIDDPDEPFCGDCIEYYWKEHKEYGRLYDWESAQIACPKGWRLPTNDDWKELYQYLGSSKEGGKKLSSTKTNKKIEKTASMRFTYNNPDGHPFWYYNPESTNTTGFSAVPSGLRMPGPNGGFTGVGTKVYWWSANEGGKENKYAIRWGITFNGIDLVHNLADKRLGLAVRCIKEDTETEDDCISSGVSISDLHGEVYIVPADNPDDFYFAELGTELCMGDIVETRGNSGAILRLRDMTSYVMSSNSNVRIGEKEKSTSGISLLTGHVFANFKRMFKDGSMDIELSQGVAGIKGTSLFISDNGNTSKVKVVKGSVQVTPKTGSSLLVNSGEAITIKNKKAQNKTKFNVKQEYDKFGAKEKQWIKKDMGSNFSILLGWKSHKIGNVSFAIPPSWKHDVYKEGNNRVDIFWYGKSVDNPTYGLSIETTDNYNEENSFFNSQDYSNIKISGKSVKQIANNELIYMLFPKIKNTNKGVVFNFISGNKNGFKNMDDIISSIKIN